MVDLSRSATFCRALTISPSHLDQHCRPLVPKQFQHNPQSRINSPSRHMRSRPESSGCQAHEAEVRHAARGTWKSRACGQTQGLRHCSDRAADNCGLGAVHQPSKFLVFVLAPDLPAGVYFSPLDCLFLKRSPPNALLSQLSSLGSL